MTLCSTASCTEKGIMWPRPPLLIGTRVDLSCHVVSFTHCHNRAKQCLSLSRFLCNVSSTDYYFFKRRLKLNRNVPFACIGKEAGLSHTYLNLCEKLVLVAWGNSNPIDYPVYRGCCTGLQQQGRKGNERGQGQRQSFVQWYYITRLYYQQSCNQ